MLEHCIFCLFVKSLLFRLQQPHPKTSHLKLVVFLLRKGPVLILDLMLALSINEKLNQSHQVASKLQIKDKNIRMIEMMEKISAPKSRYLVICPPISWHNGSYNNICQNENNSIYLYLLRGSLDLLWLPQASYIPVEIYLAIIHFQLSNHDSSKA